MDNGNNSSSNLNAAPATFPYWRTDGGSGREGSNESQIHPALRSNQFGGVGLAVQPRHPHVDRSEADDAEDAQRLPPWPVPARHTMQKRQEFRENILRETPDHRRIHHPYHHSTAEVAGHRNICTVLYHRELYTASGLAILRTPKRPIRGMCEGERSPSTVLESPPNNRLVRRASANVVPLPLPTTTDPIPSSRTSSNSSDIMESEDTQPSEQEHLQLGRQRVTVTTSAMDTDRDFNDNIHLSQNPAVNTNNSSSELPPLDENDTFKLKNQDEDDCSPDEELQFRKVVSYPRKIGSEIRTFVEYCSTVKYHSAFLHHLGGDDELDEDGNRPTSSKAVSTISVAFSPDAQTMASTHGDHTVKISCCITGRLLQSLEGHPRTPWTVKYHPTDARIVASGCLGHQVRLWNWPEKRCFQMVRLEFAIISLSFHPSGQLLAIANGTRLHFWGVDNDETVNANDNNNYNSLTGSRRRPSSTPAASSGPKLSTLVTELDQRHMLRCVHFPPGGKTIIIGGVNPTPADDARRGGRNRPNGVGGSGGMSFYLRLWDFDLSSALQPPGLGPHDPSAASSSNGPKRYISNPRTFVPRALLYNDGGFDVSPDGKTLCACAEYWLPDGYDNAMTLYHNEEMAYEAEVKRQAETGINSLSNLENDTTASAAALALSSSAVSAALTRLRGTGIEGVRGVGKSPSFRESMLEGNPGTPTNNPNNPRTPTAQIMASAPPNEGGPATTALEYIPRTPENSRPQSMRLSPPSPPGRRFAGGLQRPGGGGTGLVGGRDTVSTTGSEPVPSENPGDRGMSTPPPPPPPPPPPAPSGISRPPHPLSMISQPTSELALQKGRYVPHVVTVSLDTTPIPQEVNLRLPRGRSYGAVAKGYRPRLGQLLEACPLDGAKASAVTCVKFSPSTDFCLIGYGVREPMVEGGGHFHPVTALYRIRGGMTHVSTMLSGDDDVNISRFHPDSGHGFVYGTKQGRVRVLSPRPWMFYNC